MREENTIGAQVKREKEKKGKNSAGSGSVHL
jgi:hypothetical protein